MTSSASLALPSIRYASENSSGRCVSTWVTDITYIRTWQGGLYLAVVLDLFSRLIVGWATAPTIHRELVLNAVLMAVRRRRPRGTLIHSDQGTQYGSDAKKQIYKNREPLRKGLH